MVGKNLVGGKTVLEVHNISSPTLTLYRPAQENTGVTVVVIPGGGFEILAMNLEGTISKRRLYAPVDAADKESCRPDFAVGIYPGHLSTGGKTPHLNANVKVTQQTPPTFLVQSEDDYTDGINQTLVYYAALKDMHVPVEMHLFAQGGHAFGLRPTKFPITNWPDLMQTWLRTTGFIANERVTRPDRQAL